jgi:sugar lactone lactonase YvrE
VDEAGRPAAKVPVTAYLNNTSPLVGGSGGALANNGNPLVGGSGGSLIGGGNPYSVQARKLAAGTVTSTDETGAFSFDLTQEGAYNLEAARSNDAKAWKAAIKVAGGSQVDTGTLVLKPTGTITGRVRSDDLAVSDFTGTTVYVPGSSYLAMTKNNGEYTISNVPEGEFELAAFSNQLGRASLPSPDAPGHIKVRSKETVTPATLVLKVVLPQLRGLRRSESEESTDNGAPGETIDLYGRNLGLTGGLRFEVRFSAGTVLSPNRLTDSLIRVKVPSDARNGNILVYVDNLQTEAVKFRVIKQLSLATASILVPAGATADLSVFVSAADTDGVEIRESRDGGKILTHRPNVAWAADSLRGVVTAKGELQVLSGGAFKVTCRAGDLAPAVIDVNASAPAPAGPQRELLGKVTTLAGVGSAKDGPASEATFARAHGMALGPDGSLYVADADGHTIRRVGPDGTVSTYAGSGERGFVDGAAHIAKFASPIDVAVATSGAVYVADTANEAIRRIGPDGAVSTVADMREGRFASYGLAVDPAGTLYVSDTLGHRIKTIKPDGTVAILAGSGTKGFSDGAGQAAQFNTPVKVRLDGAGNVIVADEQNHRIRKITQAGMVSTVAGDGIPGSLDGAAPGARFQVPSGLAIDASGNIFSGDVGVPRLRRIGTDGNVSTLAGSGGFGYADGSALLGAFYRLDGIVGLADGTVLVSDQGRIRKVAGSSISTYAGNPARNGSKASASFNYPAGLAASGDGTLYVADVSNNMIRKISPDGTVSTLAGSGRQANTDGPGNQAAFALPTGVAVDANGNVFVADWINHLIRRIGPDGTVSSFAGGTGNFVDGVGQGAGFDAPVALAFGPDGDLLVADKQFHSIRKVSPFAAVSTLGGNPSQGYADGAPAEARFDEPSGVAADAGGNVYVSDSRNHVIRKFGRDGKWSTLAGTKGSGGLVDGKGADARFAQPRGMACDKNGWIYVADAYNHAIRRISPDGVVKTIAGGGEGYADGTAGGARFRYPGGVAVLPDGSLAVADTQNHRIRKIE